MLYIKWYAFHTYRLRAPLNLDAAETKSSFRRSENQKGPAKIQSCSQNKTFQPYMCQIFYSQQLELK